MHFTIVHEFERKVVVKVIEALLAAGYTHLNINHDGDYPDSEFAVKDTSEATLEEITACGEVYLYALPPGQEPKNGNYTYVYFVFGNGAAVISDYGMSLEPVLAPINAFTDKYMD